jgi:hypothetical protein
MEITSVAYEALQSQSEKQKRIDMSKPYSGPLRISPDYNHLVIDITYNCNMSCLNCNRLSNIKNKPKSTMRLSQIVAHVREWIATGKKIRHIALTGGEPTVHPQFLQILIYLNFYIRTQNGRLLVFTNGGATYQKIKNKIPEDVWVINSQKETNYQKHHFAFTYAPIDAGLYEEDDNPCRESLFCGRTLNKNGYFACPSAGAIDNFLQLDSGIKNINDATEENLRTKAKQICKYCATYLREKNIIEPKQNLNEQILSNFWKNKLKIS